MGIRWVAYVKKEEKKKKTERRKKEKWDNYLMFFLTQTLKFFLASAWFSYSVVSRFKQKEIVEILLLANMLVGICWYKAPLARTVGKRCQRLSIRLPNKSVCSTDPFQTWNIAWRCSFFLRTKVIFRNDTPPLLGVRSFKDRVKSYRCRFPY